MFFCRFFVAINTVSANKGHDICDRLLLTYNIGKESPMEPAVRNERWRTAPGAGLVGAEGTPSHAMKDRRKGVFDTS